VFYQPEPGGDVDTYFQVMGGKLVTKLDNSPYAGNVETILGDRDWTLPYDYEVLCAQVTCTIDVPRSQFISKGVLLDGVGKLLPTFPLQGDVIVESAWSDQVWDVPGLALQFAPGRRLTVEGQLAATDVTFTAGDPAQGWGGIRFEPGSGGSLTDAVIEKNYGWGQYAVWIDNASPSFDNVTINNPVSSLVGGVYVTGSQASPTLHDLDIRNLPYGGVTLESQAEVRMTNSIVTQSGHGLVAGYLTEGFLYPSLGGARTVGNQFDGNTNDGVRATSYADLYFGYYY
jgi:hypothetical protein